MSMPTIFSFQLGYSLKRRHIYIVLILLWVHLSEFRLFYSLVETPARLILAIIIALAISDSLDGYIERWWTADEDRFSEFGRNWWRGLMNKVYNDLNRQNWY